MNAKIKTAYFCQSCGSQSPKWVGKCSACGEWNTFVEEILQKEKKGSSIQTNRTAIPQLISEINLSGEQRIKISDNELSRVLGGGLVPGSVVLFGGEPGIGKSTLMLQLALKEKGLKTLYISGEESEQQVSIRAERISQAPPPTKAGTHKIRANENAHFLSVPPEEDIDFVNGQIPPLGSEGAYILTETSIQNIFHHLSALKPGLIIVDSIQTLHSSVIESSPGSVSQIRECASEFLKFAKQSQIPVFLIGHVTKDGTIAGPKVLEHMVDTVLQFEGDRNYVYRLLRTTKNRFGSTNELGIYEMVGSGLREVSNPSEILITSREEPTNGVAIAATMEGMRPMLIEIQALVSSAVYGTPQRSSTGFDLRRMNMLLAVLEKRCGFKLGIKDVFLNVAGGIKVDDPATDLSVACAILSSAEDIAIETQTCFAAEVGLTGEIRAVNRVEQRILEAEKLGFTKIFISKYNMKGLNPKQFNIDINPVKKMEDVFSSLFG